MKHRLLKMGLYSKMIYFNSNFHKNEIFSLITLGLSGILLFQLYGDCRNFYQLSCIILCNKGLHIFKL